MAEFSSVDIRKATGIPPVMVEDGKAGIHEHTGNAAHSFEGAKERADNCRDRHPEGPYERAYAGGVMTPVCRRAVPFLQREALRDRQILTTAAASTLYRSRVFEPFSHEGGWHWPGLFVSQSIIKAYGDRTGITDGAGSVFTVILPCADGVWIDEILAMTTKRRCATCSASF